MRNVVPKTLERRLSWAGQERLPNVSACKRQESGNPGVRLKDKVE